MKKNFIFLLIFLLFILPEYINAQGGLRTNGVNINISSGTSLVIPANTLISGGSDYILNNGNIFVAGNFTNNGNGLNATGTGTVTFNGSGNQNINGTNSTTFYDVTKSTNSSVIIGLDETINHNLTMTTGFFDLNNHNLTLNGAFSGSGTLTGSLTSGLIIGGAAATVNFTSGYPNNYLDTLTINSPGSITAGNALNIAAGTFTNPGTVTSDGTLNTNGNLTLKSDSNGTARVAASTIGKIINNVTAERFIPARRAWRFLGVPFYSSPQTINAAWQEGQTNTNAYACPTGDPAPAHFGTEITYNNIAGTGYDYNLTSNPSLKVWSANAWATPSTTNNTVSDNIATSYTAYCLFVRGDRQVCLSQGVGALPVFTVLRATGALYETGSSSNNVTKTYTGAAGDFMFLSNPYASTVDLNAILQPARAGTNGIDYDKFWVWNPRANGLYGVGGYVSYSGGVQVPPDTSYHGGTTIQSGQAFMVQLDAVSTTANVAFRQNDKVVPETNVFSRHAGQPYPVIYTNLMIPSENHLALTDGVGAAFGNRFSAAIDASDAQKLWNFDENIALVRGSSTLAIEFRPVPKITDTLFYRLYLRQQPYTLQIFSNNLPAGLPVQAWLVDKYLNTQTEVNLYDTTLYNFTPNTDTMSYRNRFMLVFNRVDNKTPVAGRTNSIKTEGDDNSISNIKLYPNPVSTGSVSLQFNKMDKGSYTITIFDSKGHKLASWKIVHKGNSNIYPILLNPLWTAGVYTVAVTREDLKKIMNLQMIISK